MEDQRPRGHNQPSRPVTPSEMQSAASENASKLKRLAKMEHAETCVRTIVSSYPDGGRATPEYIAGLVQALAELSPQDIEAVMDIRSGIRRRCKFLPTIAEVMGFVEERKARYAAVDDLAERVGARVPERTVRTPYRPFPKLYDAFEPDEPWLLRKNFDTLFEASRAFAMYGKDQARAVLTKGKSL